MIISILNIFLNSFKMHNWRNIYWNHFKFRIMLVAKIFIQWKMIEYLWLTKTNELKILILWNIIGYFQSWNDYTSKWHFVCNYSHFTKSFVFISISKWCQFLPIFLYLTSDFTLLINDVIELKYSENKLTSRAFYIIILSFFFCVKNISLVSYLFY